MLKITFFGLRCESTKKFEIHVYTLKLDLKSYFMCSIIDYDIEEGKSIGAYMFLVGRVNILLANIDYHKTVSGISILP